MTVSSDLNKHVYTGNGSTTVFPFTFDLLKADDLHVYITSLITGADVEITSDFIIQPTGDEYPCSSGNVVYPGYETGAEPPVSLQPPILPEGWKITLIRTLDAVQETSYPNNSALRPKVVEQDLDRLIMVLQQLKESINRAFVGGVSSTAQYSLPSPVTGAGLIWDANGNIANGSPVDTLFSVPDVQAAIDHISDATAHLASTIVNTPAGTITAINVQDAIDQLRQAQYVANTPAGNIVSTTVQAAINELDTEKAKLAGDSTQTFSVSNATSSTMATALGQFIATLATNGHIEIPVVYNSTVKKLIINWGTVLATNDTNTAVTFEKSFTTSCLCALASHNHLFSTSNDAGCGTLNWTLTGMDVRSGSAINGNVCYIAIGY